MAAKKGKGRKGSKLKCDDCGMVIVVETDCDCGCIPTCCGSPMKEK